jgi:N utilization substance protein B
MLNRRHIRIKVLQALYAAIQSEETDVYIGQKKLMEKFDKIYDLAIYQISFFEEIRDFAENRLEEAKKKNYPTQEELNPNTRFIHNRLLNQIRDNKYYQKKVDEIAANWSTEPEMLRNVFFKIQESELYQKYMTDDESTYKLDKEFAVDIFESVILPYESLHAFFEEKNLHWADDYNLAAEVVMMIFASYKPGWDENRKLPTLFKDDSEEVSQDRAFAKELFSLVLNHRDEFDLLIKPKVKNWEMDRLATIDRILIEMALAEVINMPTIPIKVSLNEYIEMSKYFSTPKSKVFINGILDHIVADLKTQGKINKQGRGLVN